MCAAAVCLAGFHRLNRQQTNVNNSLLLYRDLLDTVKRLWKCEQQTGAMDDSLAIDFHPMAESANQAYFAGSNLSRSGKCVRNQQNGQNPPVHSSSRIQARLNRG